MRDHGGVVDAPKAAAGAEHREGAAGAWRNAFLRAPFYREVLTPLGLLAAGTAWSVAVLLLANPLWHWLEARRARVASR